MTIRDLLGDLNNRYLKRRVDRQQRDLENPRATWPTDGSFNSSAAITVGSPVLRTQEGAIALDWTDRVRTPEIIIPTDVDVYPFRGLRFEANTGGGGQGA